jgi:hypothetical protein
MKATKSRTGDPIKPKKVMALDQNDRIIYVDDPELGHSEEGDTLSYVTNASERIMRQLMAESGGNAKAVSPAGARGAWQIMPATQKDLEERGYIPTGLDPFNPLDSRLMRDAKIEALSNLSFIKNPPQPIPEVNRLARIYASYNAGEGRVRSILEKAKSEGVDIYGDPRAWVEYLPEETQGYLQKILFDDSQEGE